MRRHVVVREAAGVVAESAVRFLVVSPSSESLSRTGGWYRKDGEGGGGKERSAAAADVLGFS